MTAVIDKMDEAKWNAAARKKHAQDRPEDFAGPHHSFPIKDQSDINDAWRLAGHAANPDAVRAKIKSIAKRLGLTAGLPDTAKDKNEDEECAGCESEANAVTIEDAMQLQQLKQDMSEIDASATLATIKTCWLEDDAISLNGRQYPRESVDKLIRGAQVNLSTSDSLPLTCYVSHEKADKDNTLDIAGKITQVWKEGQKAYALIDIPNTRTGRDIVTLVKGGYIRSQSLRASGAEIVADNKHTFPQVTGPLKLLGIDFTTSPGLSQIARITDIQMVAESNSSPIVQEVFNSSFSTVHLQEDRESNKQMDIKEEEIEPITSGNTDGVTGDNPRSEYSDKMYKMPPSASTDTFPQQLTDIHDRLAYVLGLECGPSTMEAQKRFGDAIVSERNNIITEKGAKLSFSNKKHIGIAHDKVAEAANLVCANKGASNAADNEPDDDDKPDDRKSTGKGAGGDNMSMAGQNESFNTLNTIEALLRSYTTIAGYNDKTLAPIIEKKEDKPMTPQEAIELLKQSGYDIKAPKTADEIMQEKIDAKLAEQAKVFEAQQTLLIEKIEKMSQNFDAKINPFKVQRKSLVEGGVDASKEKKPYYRPGDYIRENLNSEGFREQLLDRSRPLPENINPEHLLKELQLELLGAYDQRYGLVD